MPYLCQKADSWGSLESRTTVKKRMNAFYGPIILIRDVAPNIQVAGVVLLLLFLPCMLLVFIRPRPWSIVVAIMAGLAWLGVGVIGMGIDC
ncbi:hypothetical protein I41_37720 [Lacipirellula limnantheis]|uniref:Uncharacterized protein n=1 Tax=Lacipirellula limnantheis TaxID=2528024 RepID=A0A517U1R4_9BACT|nr:hypothetical protein I41_37720 [Lacipirellula limnantheis]